MLEPSPPNALTTSATAAESALALRDLLSQVAHTEDDWRVLGAIALEQGMSRSAALAMCADAASGEALLSRALSAGLMSATAAKASPNWKREQGVGLEPAAEQLVLRELTRRGELIVVAERCAKLLGARSAAAPNVALQLGDFPRFSRLAQAQRGLAASRPAETLLRLHVCCPLDPAWLQGCWGEDALSVATRVLGESLVRLDETAGLEAWVSAQHEAAPGAERRELEAVLGAHAALRGDLSSLQRWRALSEGPLALGLEAAACFLRSDLQGAGLALDAYFEAAGKRGSRRAAWVEFYGIGPMLALICCARGTTAAYSQAKHLVVGKRPESKAAAKAFRTLLGYLSSPEHNHQRIDVYQVARSGTAWELLLAGLTVELHSEQHVARASWAQQLARFGLSWQQAGYAWIGQQALLLANQLEPEYCANEILDAGGEPAQLGLEASGLQLWQCVSSKPEWQKALERLALVSESIEQRNAESFRVAWYVDMSDGSLARPALQQFRAELGTWSQGQRMPLPQLYEQREHLPAEDRRVLECSRETRQGQREHTPEALEALIGHPRVFNGARGMLPVQVLAGVPRVESQEQAGHIRLVVEPQDAKLGVNAVVEAEDRLRVYRVSAAMAQVVEALPRGVRVPKAHEAKVLAVLAKLSQSVEVQSPELGVERTVSADSTPCVRIAPHAGAWLVQVGVRPFGDKGRFFIAGEGRRRLKFYADGQRMRCIRDLEREREQVDALLAECPALLPPTDEPKSPLEAPDSEVVGEEGVLAGLAELSQARTAHALEWPEKTGLRLRGQVSSTSLKAQLRCVKGWYLAQGSVSLDGLNALSLAELVRGAPLASGRFLRLPQGDYVEVEERMRRVIAALRGMPAAKKTDLGADHSADGGLKIHRGALSTLRELASLGSGFDLDRESSGWLEQAAQLSSAEFLVPADLNATLRPYQLAGFVWLCRLAKLGLGACLADDMGLGKTLQVLAFLLTRATHGPALVVAPTSVCGNWLLEARRFAPSLDVIEYAGKHRSAALEALKPGQLVITSYALLQQDADQLAEPAWDSVVLDEAQFIKNPTSKRARAAFRLNTAQRIVATGTPVENHLGDLWSIFRFLNPGLLTDWANFRREFVRPIEQDGDDTVRQELKRRIEPYVLRRLKRDVLRELPPLTEVRYEVRFSEQEALRYAFLRKEVRDKLFTRSGKRDNKIEVLAEITRLRRYCCHPRLVFPDADAECSKLNAFLELAEELGANQHRALVFSQFVDFLELVREQLDERGVAYEYLDGSTPMNQRQARVEAFQHGSAPLFLISLKAGGFGLNLTAADYVIHLDPWWNPAVEAQATDRAHRIGQERAVTVYKLLVADSIEHSVIELHAKKKQLAEALLDGSERVGQLDTHELLRLLGEA